jgi:hypothetical protein
MLIKDFLPPHLLNTAVLFLVFNRLDITKKTFQAIRQAKPPKLYIASDGARKSVDGELEKVEEVRNFVILSIDWECEVKTLFRMDNLKGPAAVSGAINWFFGNEDMGIIIEDDCLPTQSFFWYCEDLLLKYREDLRIGMITGSNFQGSLKRGDDDYFFSVYGHSWGWATWSNRWKNHDMNFQNYNNSDFVGNIFKDKKVIRYWKKIFSSKKNWDYLWLFALWKNDQLSICPNVNLISNIGFGDGATHTVNKESILSNVNSYDIKITSHPLDVKRNFAAEDYTSKYAFNIRTIGVRIVNKVSRILIGKNIIK